MTHHRRSPVRSMLFFLAILGVFIMACSASDDEFDDDYYYVEPVPYDFCEMQYCLDDCRGSVTCEDACVYYASNGSRALEYTYQDCLATCEPIHNDQVWLDCIYDVCGDVLVMIDACYD